MTTESRKIQLEAGVNTQGAKEDLRELKDAAKDMGVGVAQAGQQAAKSLDNLAASAGGTGQKVDRESARMIGAIQRQTAVTEAGERGTRKYFEAIASQRGIDLNVLKPYLDGLDAVQKKTGDVGISAKQTAAALRGVPAQFTDIVTSLQGGQAPLTVLLQQGGQLKDMFGGIGGAVKGLGGYVLDLINPFTVILAAAGGLALLFANSGKELKNYSSALILSGNAAGATAGQLQLIGQSLASITGSQSAAAAALAEFAQSGGVAAVNLELVTGAALRFEQAAGTAISDTVKQFAELRRAPLEASIKLNDATNFLTVSLYQQIKALDEQGRATEAADLAQKSFAQTMDARTAQIKENAGTIEKAWLAVKAAVLGASSAIANIGKTAGPEASLAQAQRELASFEATRAYQASNNLATGEIDRLIGPKRELIATLQEQVRNEHRVSEEQARQAEMVRARIAFDKDADQYLSKRAQMEREITKARNEGTAAGASAAETEARIAGIRDKFKESAAKGFSDDAGTRMLQNLRETEASLRAQLAVTGELTSAQRKLAEFEQLITDLKSKRTLTQSQKEILAVEDQARAELQVVAALERQLKARSDAKKLEDEALRDRLRFASAADGIQRQASDFNRSRDEQYDRSISVIGLGSEAREQFESTKQIYREYERLQAQLTKAATDSNQLESQSYLDKTATIKASLGTALQDNASYYAGIKQKQGEWVLGASAAFADYEAAARNAFASSYQVAGTVFSGLEDLAVQLGTTGKASFASLRQAFISELIRMEYRASVSTLFKSAGGSAGLLGSVLGLFGGTGAQASAASALPGDSLDNFLSLKGLAGSRAIGGPASPNSLLQVAEGGKPELLNVGSKTYLLTGNQSGNVTPAGSALGGSAGLSVVVNNNASGVDVQARQSTRGDGGMQLEILVNAVTEQAENRIAANISDRVGPVFHALNQNG